MPSMKAAPFVEPGLTCPVVMSTGFAGAESGGPRVGDAVRRAAEAERVAAADRIR